MPDLPEFVLQNGVRISGRRAYNDYCKEHNVTNPADFKEEWAKKQREREAVHTPGAGHDSERRKRLLAENYKEFRTYGEYRQMLENMGRKR